MDNPTIIALVTLAVTNAVAVLTVVLTYLNTKRAINKQGIDLRRIEIQGNHNAAALAATTGEKGEQMGRAAEAAANLRGETTIGTPLMMPAPPIAPTTPFESIQKGT